MCSDRVLHSVGQVAVGKRQRPTRCPSRGLEGFGITIKGRTAPILIVRKTLNANFNLVHHRPANVGGCTGNVVRPGSGVVRLSFSREGEHRRGLRVVYHVCFVGRGIGVGQGIARQVGNVLTAGQVQAYCGVQSGQVSTSDRDVIRPAIDRGNVTDRGRGACHQEVCRVDIIHVFIKRGTEDQRVRVRRTGSGSLTSERRQQGCADRNRLLIEERGVQV